jgi:hypothetical protein
MMNSRIAIFAQTLWLTARTASPACRVEIGGVVDAHVIAGCPDGQIRKDVLAAGGICVLIHHVTLVSGLILMKTDIPSMERA